MVTRLKSMMSHVDLQANEVVAAMCNQMLNTMYTQVAEGGLTQVWQENTLDICLGDETIDPSVWPDTVANLIGFVNG